MIATLERPPTLDPPPFHDPFEIRSNAKVIFDSGGVLMPHAGGNPDPQLVWKVGSMFEGDAFLWSPSHGDFIRDLQEINVEVYILSGLGQQGSTIFSNLYQCELNWLKTFSEAELEVGDKLVQRKDFAVNGIHRATSGPVIWVDDNANLESSGNLLVIKPDSDVGLTRLHMNMILDFIANAA